MWPSLRIFEGQLNSRYRDLRYGLCKFQVLFDLVEDRFDEIFIEGEPIVSTRFFVTSTVHEYYLFTFFFQLFEENKEEGCLTYPSDSGEQYQSASFVVTRE